MADIEIQNLSIPKFYAGRHIFITGGSGFIGKVLVEKLLRSCPDVAGLHILLREKKGASPAERLKTIAQTELFDVLRKENSKFVEKLHVVTGDISLPGLGLDPENREFLIKNVSIVFHAAATVRFNDPMTRALILNVRGTRDVALLAKEMPNLAVFVHVSTTYCNSDKMVVEEKLYPPHGNWRTMIKASEKLDQRVIGTLASKIQGSLPNSYTFTKSLAEHCVRDILKEKPLIIVRPSVVVSTISEPVRGWIDNYNGPIGLLVAGGKGLMHITLGSDETITDYIPVDVVIKVFLIAAFKHGSKQVAEKELPVYNCSAATKSMTAVRMREKLLESITLTPFSDTLWIQSGYFTANRFVLLLGTLVLHMIPATVLDTVLRLKGHKPRLAKIHRIIYIAQTTLEPFILNSWIFKNDKSLSLENDIPDQDRNEFSFDFIDEDLTEICRWNTLGARRYILKESDDSLPAARLHRRRMVYLKNMVSFFGYISLAWFLLLVLVPRLL